MYRRHSEKFKMRDVTTEQAPVTPTLPTYHPLPVGQF